MDFPWKRLAVIVGFIVLVLALAYGLYAVFFQSSVPTNTPTAGQPPAGGLPTIGAGTPGQLTNTPGGLPITNQPAPTSPTPSPVANGGLTETDLLVQTRAIGATTDGSAVVYYQPQDGHFYRTTPNGTTTPLSSQVFHNVEQVTWSPDRNAAVLEYPDNAKIVYNFTTNKQVTLPKHWEDFSFSPSSDQLAFKILGIDTSSRWLGVADVDGGAPTAIEALGDNANKVDVNWSPSRQVVATYRENTGADREEIYFVGLHGENFKSMTAPGIDLQSQWTPDGQRLLYSASSGSSGYKPTLWIADAAGDNIGQNRQNIGLNTWADKCTFSSSTNLICAVPNNLPDGAGLAPAIATTSPDTFYRVDLTTGRTQVMAQPTTNVSATNLTVSTDGHTLFFQDATSGQIYKISI